MPFKKIMKLKTHKNNEFMGAKPKIMYLANHEIFVQMNYHSNM